MTSLECLLGNRITIVDRYLAIAPQPSAPVSAFDDLTFKFIIGCTSRTGSNLLCEYLYSQGMLADEFLNHAVLKTYKTQSSAGDYGEICSYVAKEYSRNGGFGLKGDFHQIIPLYLINEFPRNIESWRFVFLTRRNTIRQAISVVIADKTRSYRSSQKPEFEMRLDDYSPSAISKAAQSIMNANASWEWFFSAYEIAPLRISYEDLMADPTQVVRAVREHCGIPDRAFPPVEPPHPPVYSQSTELNVEWEKRFRADLRTAL